MIIGPGTARKIDVDRLRTEAIAAGIPLPEPLVLTGDELLMQNLLTTNGLGEPIDVPEALRDFIAVHLVTRETSRSEARTALITVAQGAVGQTPLNWTNNQFRALVALLIYNLDGLNSDTTLRPLTSWLRD